MPVVPEMAPGSSSFLQQGKWLHELNRMRPIHNHVTSGDGPEHPDPLDVRMKHTAMFKPNQDFSNPENEDADNFDDDDDLLMMPPPPPPMLMRQNAVYSLEDLEMPKSSGISLSRGGLTRSQSRPLNPRESLHPPKAFLSMFNATVERNPS